MELCISMAYPLHKRGGNGRQPFGKAIELCLGAGFRFLDYTPEYNYAGWQDGVLREKEQLDAAGIAVEQAHAPFYRCRTYYDPLEFPREFHRCFEAAALIGAKFIVVHADEYRPTTRYDVDEIVEYTYEYMAPEVEYARKHGLKVAVESLFEEGATSCRTIYGCSRFTSRANEIKAIIERFNDPTVVCCWDFGHARLAYGREGMTDALRELGPYVQCTHVHDNYLNRDLHLRPFLGDVDWETQMACMRSINYGGKLSFELGYGSIPDELFPLEMKMVKATGDYLVSLFDGTRPK